MREILFRGKRVDNGELVEGYLLKSQRVSGSIFIVTTGLDPDNLLSCLNKSRGDAELWSVYQVDPTTIGQYTGLKDKNGKRIFEGDIVRYYERQLGGADAPVIQSVGYEEGGFCVRYYFLNNWLRNAVNGNIQLEGIEVIGNIHNNPELIGGGGHVGEG